MSQKSQNLHSNPFLKQNPFLRRQNFMSCLNLNLNLNLKDYHSFQTSKSSNNSQPVITNQHHHNYNDYSHLYATCDGKPKYNHNQNSNNNNNKKMQKMTNPFFRRHLLSSVNVSDNQYTDYVQIPNIRLENKNIPKPQFLVEKQNNCMQKNNIYSDLSYCRQKQSNIDVNKNEHRLSYLDKQNICNANNGYLVSPRFPSTKIIQNINININTNTNDKANASVPPLCYRVSLKNIQSPNAKNENKVHFHVHSRRHSSQKQINSSRNSKQSEASNSNSNSNQKKQKQNYTPENDDSNPMTISIRGCTFYRNTVHRFR